MHPHMYDAQGIAQNHCCEKLVCIVLDRGQAEREEKQRMRQEMGLPTDDENALGSFDNGDPYTTNLYIGMAASLAVLGVLPVHVRRLRAVFNFPSSSLTLRSFGAC